MRSSTASCPPRPCIECSVFPASEPLENALPAILKEHVVLVTEQDHPIGILTKIDVLDFIAQEI